MILAVEAIIRGIGNTKVDNISMRVSAHYLQAEVLLHILVRYNMKNAKRYPGPILGLKKSKKDQPNTPSVIMVIECNVHIMVLT